MARGKEGGEGNYKVELKRERERKNKERKKEEKDRGRVRLLRKTAKKRHRQRSLLYRGSQQHDESECGHKICLAFAIFTSPIIHLVFPKNFEKNKQTKLTMEPSPKTKELRPIGVQLNESF